MIISTSEHRAMTRELLQLRKRNAELQEAHQQSTRQNVALLVRIKDAESLASYWYHAWGQMLEWWTTCRQHLKRYHAREEWRAAVMATDLDPKAKILQFAVRDITDQRQADPDGYARVYRSELERATHLRGGTLDRARKDLIASGVTREQHGAYNPKTGEASLFMAMQPEAIAQPAAQARPADAPVRGGNHRHICPACGAVDIEKVEDRVIRVVTCTGCGHTEEMVAPSRLVSFPDLTEEMPKPDPWAEQIRAARTGRTTVLPSVVEDVSDLEQTEIYDATADWYGEEQIAPPQPPMKLPAQDVQLRVGEHACPICGGHQQRYKLTTNSWVCYNCDFNPFVRRGA